MRAGFREWGAWLALLLGAAGADGSVPASARTTTHLGVPDVDVDFFHCRSGRTVPLFSGNTASVHIQYRGRAYGLEALGAQAPRPTPFRYSDVGLRSLAPNFDADRMGPGLEWRWSAYDPGGRAQALLYRVVQQADGARSYRLLERCTGRSDQLGQR